MRMLIITEYDDYRPYFVALLTDSGSVGGVSCQLTHKALVWPDQFCAS